jgi:hypothetical protein
MSLPPEALRHQVPLIGVIGSVWCGHGQGDQLAILPKEIALVLLADRLLTISLCMSVSGQA